jgi:putative addiction module component (TIGR02574 family)
VKADPAKLLSEALSLPSEARAALIDTLLESLDSEIDPDAQETWRQEIRRRVQEIDNGAVKLIPWDDARRDLWARLQH